MSPADFLLLWQALPEKERDYVTAYARALIAGQNPIEAAKALATAYAGETAADEILKRGLG